MRRTLTTLSFATIALALALPAQAQEPIEIQEWEVPWEASVPRDPFVGPDGMVWFVGQRGHYVAYLDRATGEFTKFDLGEGTGPHNLIVDEDGMVFYAGNRVNHIGRLDPTTGDITKFMMPDEAARDPHTMVWNEDGDIWFTVQNGNFVGKLWKETGEVRLVNMPETQGRRPTSRPYGIKLDSSDQPWIVLFNTNKIATVDQESFELTTYDLPDERSRPRRMVIDSQDNVWWVDYALGKLGRLVPGTEEVTEWELPNAGSSRPYAMEIDPDDRIWVVETGIQPNNFVGFDPETEEFFSQTEIGSGGSTIRHMYYEAETNSIWFGADTNTVGQAKLPPLKKRITTDRQ